MVVTVHVTATVSGFGMSCTGKGLESAAPGSCTGKLKRTKLFHKAIGVQIDFCSGYYSSNQTYYSNRKPVDFPGKFLDLPTYVSSLCHNGGIALIDSSIGETTAFPNYGERKVTCRWFSWPWHQKIRPCTHPLAEFNLFPHNLHGCLVHCHLFGVFLFSERWRLPGNTF